MQKTLKRTVSFKGRGLHSNAPVSVHVHPCGPDDGITFKRIDVQDKNPYIAASYENIVDTRLCTVIGNEDGVSVATIEHLMAALRGCGIDNALIEIDGPEVPAMDGSSIEYIESFRKTGTQEQALPARAIKILKPVTVQNGDKKVTLSPDLWSIYVSDIRYNNPVIGHQKFEFTLKDAKSFEKQIARARTFGLMSDVKLMREHGRGLGGGLHNAVVVDDLETQSVLNPEGTHYADEFARHKVLDAIGDLALLGGPLIGRYEGLRAGHDMHAKIMQALMQDPDAYMICNLYVNQDEENMAGPYQSPSADVLSGTASWS